MSWDPVLEKNTTTRIRQPSQIPRKPIGNRHASLEAVHVTNRHGTDSWDTNGVSPVSRLSSGFRSPVDRVTSSYFSPDSIRFSRNISILPTHTGMNNFPLGDLDAREAEVRMEHHHSVTDYSNRGSTFRLYSEIIPQRNGRLPNESGIGAHAYPLFGMSVDEAAFLESSGFPGQAEASNLNLEQSVIIEAVQPHETYHTGLGQIYPDSIIREERWEQITELVAFGPSDPCCRRRGDSDGASKWLPISLRWWFMTLLFLTSLGLGLATLLLTLHSQNHQGLGIEKNTSTFLFTWKFVPTLLAVIYIRLVMAMIKDIKRTEPYARLSRPTGASATSTLFLKPGSIWSDPYTTLKKSNNDGLRNWPLFWASLTTILALLIVGPFSSAFIYSTEVILLSSSNFSTISAPRDGPLNLSIDDSVLFRTISSVLLGTNTSAWVSNDYAVFPFWLPDRQTIPLGGDVLSSSQQWTANATVYRADLQCSLMSLQSVANFTLPGNTSSSDINLISFVLRSQDGCSFGLAGFSPDFGSNTIFGAGGGWWSGAPNFSYPLLWSPGNGTAEDLNSEHPILLNTTAQCGTRSMFFFADPYVQNQTFNASGQICTSSYFSATLPVTVSNTQITPSVTFDAKAFDSLKEPIASSVLNIPNFETAFLSQDWSSKFQAPNWSTISDLPLRPKFGGPLNLLGAQNKFNLSKMLANSNLTDQARQIKQRFFGESMMSAFYQIGSQQSEPIPGTTAVAERRIVVSRAVGIILSVALLLSSFMLLLVTWFTQLRQRPLNLLQDPASLEVIASLISSRPDIQSLFEGTDRACEYAMNRKLTSRVLCLRDGELYVCGMNDAFQPSSNVHADSILLETDDWCPEILRGSILRLFLGLTIVVALILAVLLALFCKSPIFEPLLIPESSQNFNDRAVIALAPYSVIPSLISLIVLLCWASVVETFRGLQPYVSMARKAFLDSRNPSSYINIPLLWTIATATLNRDFLLAVVAVCAVLSQILTVSISGLWDVTPGFRKQNATVLRSMEFRTVPAIFTVLSPSAGLASDIESSTSEEVLTNVFGNFHTSWLYSSVNEGVYNSTPPAWTSQNWSFAPFNLTLLQADSKNQSALSTSALGHAAINITVETPSLRSRLDCIPLDMSNTSTWLTTLDFTDKTAWNTIKLADNDTIGYELKLPIDESNPYFNYSGMEYGMASCGTERNGSEKAAIGYWSPGADDPHASFVVTWITGHRFLSNCSSSTAQIRWIWKDIPKIAALKCIPVFESAHASLNVDLATGAVHNYTITNVPVENLSAWSRRYQSLNVSTGVSFSSSPGVGAGFQSKPGTFLQNVSVSYGYLFHDVILGAANVARIGVTPRTNSVMAANLGDRTFNFRFPGLNADFMSYTSLALAGNNKSALLDPATLGNISSSVFSIFFKNFIQANVTAKNSLYMDGTWGMQPLGAVLPPDLGPILDSNPTVSLQNSLQPSSINSTAYAILSTRVEKLYINYTVAIICLGILSFFIMTIVVVIVCRRQYMSVLPRDVDTLGSILGLVYGSERLLKLAGETVKEKDKSPEKKMLKMGWFEVGQKKRWGIEIVKPGDEFLKEFIGADRGFKEVRLSH